MFEKLDKLRADLKRAEQRRDEAIAKVKTAEEKLREAENTQVLSDVSALNLTPEQVAQFLQLVASGQLPINNGTGASKFGTAVQNQNIETAYVENEDIENDDFDEENMEEYDDEK